MPFPLADITTPRLLLDKSRCMQNIKRMLQKAAANKLKFRPHFKTHQSHQVGRWFRKLGVDKIAVSSLQMAAYFAEDGWKDITVAFPVNLREHELLVDLSKRIQLNIIVEDIEVVMALNALLENKVRTFIKIDVGASRTGLKTKAMPAIRQLVGTIKQASQLEFAGFLAHAGQSYAARSTGQIQKVHNTSLQKLNQLKAHFIQDFPQLEISVGDTPSCSVAKNWAGVSEIRPGNFVFYDLMQWQIGACDLENIAVAMACPVVAKHTDRQEVVLYAGGIHLAKDHLILQDRLCYGLLAPLHDEQWELPQAENYLRSISQEHGIARLATKLFNQLSIGDLVAVLPIHSCMTADCMRAYLTNEGEDFDHFRAS